MVLVLIDCQFFETFGNRIGFNQFLEVLQFFSFYRFRRIVAGRYGLCKFKAFTGRGDADDDDQDGHDSRDAEQEPFLLRQVDVEHVEVVSPEDNDSQENPGDDRDPGEAGLAHGADDDGRDGQGNDGQELVRYAENRPNGGQVALEYDVTPCAGDQSRCDDAAGEPMGIAELRPYAADEFLEHVAADAGAGVMMVMMNRASNMMQK